MFKNLQNHFSEKYNFHDNNDIETLYKYFVSKRSEAIKLSMDYILHDVKLK